MPHSHRQRKRPKKEKGIGFKLLDLKEHLDKNTHFIGSYFDDPSHCIQEFIEELPSSSSLPRLRSYHHSQLFEDLEAFAQTQRNRELPQLPEDLYLIKSSEDHTQILDKRKRLLAYRYRAPLSLLEELESSASLLLYEKPREVVLERGQNMAWRGPFSSRNYNYNPAYTGANPLFSGDFLHDLPQSEHFLQRNASLFEWLSRNFRLIAPDIASRFESVAEQGVPLSELHRERFQKQGLAPPLRYHPLCGTFASCAVNQCMVPPISTSNPASSGCRLHRDTNDSASGLSVVVPFGQFTGGNLILVELGMEIELLRGDVLFFKGGIITHGNTPISSGSRGSLAIYTSEKTLVWSRQARMSNVDPATYKPTEEGKRFQLHKSRIKSQKREAIRKKQKQQRV